MFDYNKDLDSYNITTQTSNGKKALTAPGANGNIELADVAPGNKNQQWLLIRDVTTGQFVLANTEHVQTVIAANSVPQVLDNVVGLSYKPGELKQLLVLQKTQKPTPPPVEKPVLVDGVYRIPTYIDENNKVMQIPNTPELSDSNVNLWDDYATAKSQMWDVKHVAGNVYTLANHAKPESLLARNVSNNNVEVKEIDATDPIAQWLISETQSGAMVLQNNSDNSLVLDLQGSDTSNGTNIQVSKYSDDMNQKWVFVDISEFTDIETCISYEDTEHSLLFIVQSYSRQITNNCKAFVDVRVNFTRGYSSQWVSLSPNGDVRNFSSLHLGAPPVLFGAPYPIGHEIRNVRPIVNSSAFSLQQTQTPQLGVTQSGDATVRMTRNSEQVDTFEVENVTEGISFEVEAPSNALFGSPDIRWKDENNVEHVFVGNLSADKKRLVYRDPSFVANINNHTDISVSLIGDVLANGHFHDGSMKVVKGNGLSEILDNLDNEFSVYETVLGFMAVPHILPIVEGAGFVGEVTDEIVIYDTNQPITGSMTVVAPEGTTFDNVRTNMGGQVSYSEGNRIANIPETMFGGGGATVWVKLEVAKTTQPGALPNGFVYINDDRNVHLAVGAIKLDVAEKRPQPPRNLRANNVTSSDVILDWNGPRNDPRVGDVFGYEIYQNNELVHITEGNVFSYNVTNLDPNKTYRFVVKTTDDGNVSAPSNEVVVTTLRDQ